MKPSDVPFVMLLIQSWWILATVATIAVVVAGVIGYVIGQGSRSEGHTIEIVELINQILATWYDFAIKNGIEAVPVGVEFHNAKSMFLQPEQAVVVVRQGKQDQYFRVVKERYSDLRVEHTTYTFVLDESPRLEE